MKINNKMMDIILIIIVGLITTWLSIGSHKKDTKIEEANKLLNSKQDLLNSKQDLITNLQDEIIRLQGILQEKSDLQLKNIQKLQNPIPETLGIQFTSTLNLSKKEIEDIKAVVKSINSKNGNLFPFESNQTNEGFEKINCFKNLHLRLIITFQKDEKNMKIVFNRGPLNLMGYNTNGTLNSFTLYIDDIKNVMRFDGLLIESESITTNYISPSILDFENSKVKIYYDFSFPTTMVFGSLPTNTYISNNREYLLLNIESLSLSNKKLSINIANLKQVDSHNFEGNWVGIN